MPDKLPLIPFGVVMDFMDLVRVDLMIIEGPLRHFAMRRPAGGGRLTIALSTPLRVIDGYDKRGYVKRKHFEYVAYAIIDEMIRRGEIPPAEAQIP